MKLTREHATVVFLPLFSVRCFITLVVVFNACGGWVSHNSNKKNVQYPVANFALVPLLPTLSLSLSLCLIVWITAPFYDIMSVHSSACLRKIKVFFIGIISSKINRAQSFIHPSTPTHTHICLLYNVECFVICECVCLWIFVCVRK